MCVCMCVHTHTPLLKNEDSTFAMLEEKNYSSVKRIKNKVYGKYVYLIWIFLKYNIYFLFRPFVFR